MRQKEGLIMNSVTKLLAVSLVLALSAFIVGCSSGSASSSASASSSNASSSSTAQSSSDKTSVDASNLTDGEYTVAASLTAGKGEGSIESPARFIVTNDDKHAYIVWSSEGYESMTVDGVEYYPVPRAGNTTFEIVFDDFDREIPISVTKADGDGSPVYEGAIVFDSNTITR